MRRWLVAFAIAAVSAAVVVVAHDDGSDDLTAADQEHGVVDKIVDGDTLWIRLGRLTEKVRLVLIDAPETHHPTKGRECFGAEATAAITELVPVGTAVEIERALDDRDRYGRLLALVWRTRDHLQVNRELVADGFARVLVIEPNTQGAVGLRGVENEARQNKRGLWGRCPSQNAAASPRQEAALLGQRF